MRNYSRKGEYDDRESVHSEIDCLASGAMVPLFSLPQIDEDPTTPWGVPMLLNRLTTEGPNVSPCHTHTPHTPVGHRHSEEKEGEKAWGKGKDYACQACMYKVTHDIDTLISTFPATPLKAFSADLKGNFTLGASGLVVKSEAFLG